MKLTALALLLLLLSSNGIADSIRTSSPEKQGVSSERLSRLEQLTQRYVDDRKLAGVITMVNRGGKLIHNETVGFRGADDKRPLENDHLFRIYSMTNPIVAVAAMQLYEQGKFSLRDPISKYVPELEDVKVLNDEGKLVEPKRPITMGHLLTHTAGFSYGFSPNSAIDKQYRAAQLFQAKNLTAFVEKLAQLPLQYHPGEQWHYSVAVDVTGLIVERLSGMPLDQYLENNIFQPLGMTDTFFSVPADKMDRFLPNHNWDRKDESLKTIGADAGGGAMISYTDVTLFSGGGGLVSTAHDYMRFAEMLRAQGSFKGNQILSPKTIKFMTKDHLPKNTTVSGSGENPLSQAFRGFGFGLGFGVITDIVETQASGSEGSYMWGGAAGTIFWVDPEEDLVALCMIQLMGSPWPLREELRILTYQALTESLEE